MAPMTGAPSPDTALIGPGDPPPVTVGRPGGASPYIIICEHAGNAIPKRLGALGLEAGNLERHIAYDIGAADVAGAMSGHLDATLILQPYSRLVADCNRAPDDPEFIVTLSEDVEIPGNIDLDDADAEARRREVFRPFHDRIAAELDARRAAGRPSRIVSVHSFTPVFDGRTRPWQVGIMYNRDRRLADVLLGLLAGQGDLCVGDNQPFQMTGDNVYTLPVHAGRRGVPGVEIEIRQDLIATRAGREAWAARLGRLLERAGEALSGLEH
ncbi:MAG: N-formylglutamate amidohydrolase [Rhodospirillales bacterium]